jgi:predicted dehydrogenase
MTADKLRVAVVGTGRWARVAHIPGWLRDPRVEVLTPRRSSACLGR